MLLVPIMAKCVEELDVYQKAMDASARSVDDHPARFVQA